MLDTIIGFFVRNAIPGTARAFARFRGIDGTIRYKVVVRGKALYLNLCPCDYLDREVIRHGYYENDVLSELLDAPKNAIIWDIGANIGLHSAAMASNRPDVSIVAVEANPLLVKRLLANVGLSTNVRVCVCGLSAEFGLLPFSIMLSGNTGLSSFSPLGEIEYDKVLSIASIPACQLSSECPTYVKIDVEGHEIEVLKGFGSFRSQVKKYVIETSMPDDVLELLGKELYTCAPLGASHKRDFVFNRIEVL